MTAIGSTRQVMADAWKALGAHLAGCTGAPGTGGTVANEIAGGGYARVATTWSSGTTGTVTGTQVLLTVPACTATHGAVCVSGAGNQFDNADIADTVFATPGQLVLNPTFTVT